MDRSIDARRDSLGRPSIGRIRFASWTQTFEQWCVYLIEEHRVGFLRDFAAARDSSLYVSNKRTCLWLANTVALG